MDAWVYGVILAPFGALIIFGGIALPIKMAIARWMPDGWLKRNLLAERWNSRCSRSNGRVLAQAAAYTLRHKK